MKQPEESAESEDDFNSAEEEDNPDTLPHADSEVRILEMHVKNNYTYIVQ